MLVLHFAQAEEFKTVTALFQRVFISTAHRS